MPPTGLSRPRTCADDLLLRAPLMTNTVQAGKTTTDIIDRKLGDVVVDENGNYDFSNDKTWGNAICARSRCHR